MSMLAGLDRYEACKRGQVCSVGEFAAYQLVHLLKMNYSAVVLRFVAVDHTGRCLSFYLLSFVIAPYRPPIRKVRDRGIGRKRASWFRVHSRPRFEGWLMVRYWIGERGVS
jgi:hypothetical protein